MAPHEEDVEEELEDLEDNSRFVEEDDDTGPHTYVVDLPAVFLAPAWSAAGDAAEADCGEAFDVPAVSRAFSLCARVRRPADGAAAGTGRILSKGELPDGWLFAATSKVRFAIAEDPPPPEVDPDAADPPPPPPPLPAGQVVGHTQIDDGEWHHVAVVVHDDGSVALFVDGKPDSDVITLQVHPVPGQPLLLGLAAAEVEAGAELKDVQAYSEPLTPRQVAGLAAESKDLGTGLTLSLLPEQVYEYRRLKAEGGEEGPESARALLARAGLGDRLGRDFQQEVVLDLFEDLMDYAELMCLTGRKTSVIVRILEALLELMHENSRSAKRLGETSSVHECFQEFKRLLLAHSFAAATTARKMNVAQEVPGTSNFALGVFTLAEVRLLTEFVTGALFQQFLLYQCVLVAPQDQVTSYVEVEVPTPSPPPKLAKAKWKPKGLKNASEKVKINDSGFMRSQSRSSLPKPAQQPEAAGEPSPLPEEQGYSLDDSLAQLPEDLSVEAHHEEATKAAELTAETSIKRHDKDLAPA
mmetsp:Transcript_42158/g.98358  ORF Transcript_42158/g.98358 Transcript_42158/m.98358 type:complete len:526 (-) Transcript_42158:65-1642(-)